MTTALAGPLHLLALVLMVSGVQKLVSPRPAARAMRAAGLPLVRAGAVAGTVLGAAEVVVGVGVLAAPGRATVVALGATYLAFAAFLLRLRSVDADAGCGCFGSSSAPPGRAHLLLDLAGGTVGFGAAVLGAPDIVDVFDDGLAVGVPYLALLAAGASLLLLGPALLAELDAGRDGREPAAPSFRITGEEPAR